MEASSNNYSTNRLSSSYEPIVDANPVSAKKVNGFFIHTFESIKLTAKKEIFLTLAMSASVILTIGVATVFIVLTAAIALPLLFPALAVGGVIMTFIAGNAVAILAATGIALAATSTATLITLLAWNSARRKAHCYNSLFTSH